MSDEVDSSREHHVTIGDHTLVGLGLARGETGYARVIERPPMFTHQYREAIVIRIADQSRKVLLARKGNSFARERLGQRRAMKLLGVGERAVEIEDDGANHSG